MTEILIKLFVKNYDESENVKVRARYGLLGSIVGILSNILLFIIKLTIGILLNSISVMADAFNNLSDAISSVITFIGVKLANRPADKEHPFGHGRYEYITALVIAFIVIQVGFTFFNNAIDKIRNPENLSFSFIAVLILLISVFIKIWLGLFYMKLGNKINSSALKATSVDAFGDVITSTATIVSILIYRYSGFYVDGIMGLIVSVLVMLAGFNIAKETLIPLIGEGASPKVYKTITEFVENYEGILGSHDLIVHNYGPNKTMATIHAEIPNNVDLEKAHEIIDKIERDALRNLNVFLVIHIDPIEILNQKILECKKMVYQIVSELDQNISVHDIRIIEENEQMNVIFDVVIPHNYSVEKEKELMQQINESIQEKNSRCNCLITMENSYFSK